AGAWTIDSNEARGRPRPGIAKLATESDEGSASILVTPAAGFTLTTEREDGAYTIDVVPRTPPQGAKSKAAEVPGPVEQDAARPAAPVPAPVRTAES
ncbi:hypothetical protein ACLBYF_34285, partial [Methylobacterium brachiatum]